MRRHLQWFAILAAVHLLRLAPGAGAGDDTSAKPRGDLGKIQGKWSGKFGPGDGVPLTVTFKGNGVTVDAQTPDGVAIQVKGEIRLDEEAKPHKAIDWLKFTTDSGDGLPDRQGIYLFEDENTLKTTTAAGDGVRPGSFDGGEAGTLTIIFKREKTDDAGK